MLFNSKNLFNYISKSITHLYFFLNLIPYSKNKIMKISLSILVAFFFTLAAAAQNKTTSGKMVTGTKYWCSRCDYSSAKAGSCPIHHTSLIKEGLYFCWGEEDHPSATPGTCKDGTERAKMDATMIQKNIEATKMKIEKDKLRENNK